MVVRFPWESVAAATWAESALAGWLDAARWPDGGVLGAVRWARTVSEPAEVARRLAEPTAARVGVRRGGALAVALAPWPLWRAIARRVLDEPADRELAAPRPPTPAERAFVAVALADALGRAGLDATVEPIDDVPRLVGALLCELTVTAPVASGLAIAMPRVRTAPARGLAGLVGTRGDRLPPVSATLELARGTLGGRAALGDVRRRDVIVVGPAAAILWIGAGGIAVALDPGGGGLIVRAPYRRAIAMTTAPDRHDDPEPLGDDLRIPLTIVVADVTVSARQLLELAPGQVLATGRPIGTAVEVRAGARVVARGELVTIDGALGVRVTDIDDAAPTAELVATTPPMVVPAPR